MKKKEVIEKVLGYHPSLGDNYNGCDEFKWGNQDEECTGVVVALVPTINVLKKAISLKANLIIVHEPNNHTNNDHPGWDEDFKNSVFEEKAQLLEEYGISIWRDHDHMHIHQPDQIFTGVLKYLGWDKSFYLNKNTGSFPHYICDIEETSLKDLCEHLISTIGLNGCRFMGNPDLKVKRVAIVGHLFPGRREFDYSAHIIKEFEEAKVDVILPLETIDWTVLSYIRDGVQLGKLVGMISVGHFNIEELGMKYLCEQIKNLVPELQFTYVESEDIFNYYVK